MGLSMGSNPALRLSRWEAEPVRNSDESGMPNGSGGRITVLLEKGVGMKCRAELGGEARDGSRPRLPMVQPLLAYRISRRQRPALMRFLSPVPVPLPLDLKMSR